MILIDISEYLLNGILALILVHYMLFLINTYKRKRDE